MSKQKLTETQRGEILELVRQGKYKQRTIAAMYGVSPSLVSAIVRKDRGNDTETKMPIKWIYEWTDVTRKAMEYIAFVKKKKTVRLLEGRR